MAIWESRAVCMECGWHCEAPHGSVFLALPVQNVCPKCGNDRKGFAIKVMRWNNGKFIFSRKSPYLIRMPGFWEELGAYNK